MTCVFALADSPSKTTIAPLRHADNRSITRTLDVPGSASFTIPLRDPLASYIVPIRTALRVVIDGVEKWSGYIWTTSEDTESGVMTVTAISWLEVLNHRLVQPSQVANGAGFVQGDAGDLIKILLAWANAQGPVLTGARSSTFITQGLVYPSVQRQRTYTALENIGEAIKELTDIEDGVDIDVDPVTRTLGVYWPTFGALNEKLIFRLRSGSPAGKTLRNTLAKASRLRDGSKMATRQWVLGSSNQNGFAEDTSAQSIYGLWEDQASLTSVVDPTILGAYANAELITKAAPVTTLSFDPLTSVIGSAVPRPFVDFDVGDTGVFSVEDGSFVLSKQKARIFGFTASYTTEGNEQVSGLQIQMSE